MIAFLGESQVGKSSLINHLAGLRFLPTTGTGGPRSQAVCEWRIPSTRIEDSRWNVRVEWLPSEFLAAFATTQDGPRRRLLCSGIGSESAEEAILRTLQEILQEPGPLSPERLLAGRESSWLPSGHARSVQEWRRLIEMLTAGWPAALSAVVRIVPDLAHSLCLVDLPGLGHADVGGEASRFWLAKNRTKVDTIALVVGRRTPEMIEEVLSQYWSPAELSERLHIVATFAGNVIEDRSDPAERRRAAERRRRVAAEHLRALTRNSIELNDAFDRTFCIDPRPDTKFDQRVEFEGERERFRQLLLSRSRSTDFSSQANAVAHRSGDRWFLSTNGLDREQPDTAGTIHDRSAK